VAGSAPAAVSGRSDAAIVELVTAALAKVTHHSVVVLDRDLRYRAVAGAAHRDGPFGVDAMLDRSAREVLPPEVWGRYGPLMHAALEGRTASITETSHVLGHPVETTCSPVVADGRIVGVVAVSRDVEAAEVPDEPGEEVRTAFGLTFDHSPICQALLSPDGRWVRANRAFCALLGVREADLVGRPMAVVIDPRDHGVEEAWLTRLRDGQLEGYALPSRFVHADGHTIRVHVRLAAARGAGGELLGFVGQLIDLH
jgi:PAS domain S-box-containing protein